MSNSSNSSSGPKDLSNNPPDVEGKQLLALVERIERLEEEKKAIAEDIKEIYSEAKGSGFDTKVLRSLISLRKKDAIEREEHETILDLYKRAIGMT